MKTTRQLKIKIKSRRKRKRLYEKKYIYEAK